METKLYVNDLKKYLSEKNEKQLTKEIVELFRAFQQVQEYFAVRISSENNKTTLDKYKRILKDQIFPDKGLPKLKLSVVNKALSDYKKISTDHNSVIDLMLFFVEQGIASANEYGGIGDGFELKISDIYEKALKLIKRHYLIKDFQERCEKIIGSTSENSWSLNDNLVSVHEEYFSLIARL